MASKSSGICGAERRGRRAEICILKHYSSKSATLRLAGGEARRVVALEAEARLRRIALRLADSSGREMPRATQSAKLGAVERMSVFIAENYTRPLAIEEIAVAARMHPNSAMRLFRRNCGMTLLDCLNLHRIWHAQRLLSTEALSSRELARLCGFGSPARFYAAFKKITGHTLRRYLNSLGR